MRKVRPRTTGEDFVSDLKTRYVWRKSDDDKSSPKITIPIVSHGGENITLHRCKGDRRTTVDWGEDGWGHNGQQTDPFIGAPCSRKTLSSVIVNKDLCLYLEGIATFIISSFVLYQILISCNKVQLNYFKII